MKAAFPCMGNTPIPLAAIFRALGAEAIVSPQADLSAVAVGARYSPEQMCIPFKITLANVMRALDSGADTLVYVGGSWSCRFGYYARLQPDILEAMGYRFQTLILRHDGYPDIAREVIRLSEGNLPCALVRSAKAVRIGWLKSVAVDQVEQLTWKYRPLEAKIGESSRLYKSFLAQIDACDSPVELRKIRQRAVESFAALKRKDGFRPMRIRVLGESFCVLEPLVNFNILERLGTIGVWVDPFLTTHRWLGFHAIRFGDAKRQRLLKAARRYWRYNTGGEDENAVAYMLDAAGQGYDGVIHLHPFACMPGTVVVPVLNQLSREYDIPLLDISLDEHTAEAGLHTRLEAFISVLEHRQHRHRSLLTGRHFRA